MSANAITDDVLRIEVRLFGGPIVLVEGEPIRLSKYQSYLVALVFGHGEEGISRSRLIDYLWDEPDGALQRHRLSQLLLGVKKKCGRQIMRDDGGFFTERPRRPGVRPNAGSAIGQTPGVSRI